MKIETIPTVDLIPYARNARKHSDAQVAQIAGSIKEFGFNVPVLIDKDNMLIAGHGRVLAAQLLKIGELPCIRLEHMTENQKKAFIIADNKLTLNSDWDLDLLRLEMDDLKLADFDLGVVGFSLDEIEGLEKINPNEYGLDDAEQGSDPDSFALEAIFPSAEERQEIYDRLLADGYIVKLKDLSR